MVAFFINIFCLCTFRAISDKPQSLKLEAFRFYNITIIDMDDRILWNHSTNESQIRLLRIFGNTPVKVPGETLYRIDLFRIFMKLVNNVCQKTALRGEHAVGHIGCKLSVGFRKMFGNFFEKVKISRFI